MPQVASPRRGLMVLVVAVGVACILTAVALWASSVSASTATLVHLYNLGGNLDDSIGTLPLSANGGSLTTAPGRFTVGQSQGLSLTGGLTDTSDYSIVLIVESDQLSGFEKMIDFQNFASPLGLYSLNDMLVFFNLTARGPSQLFPNTDFHVALTRDSVTSTTAGYVDGVRQWTFSDTANDALPLNNILNFFQSSFAGSVDCIAIFDGPLTGIEIDGLADDGKCSQFQDITPPEIAVSLSPNVLHSPNHKMIDILATITVTDDADPAPTFVLTSITSDELDDANGNGDGKTVDDIQGAALGTNDVEFKLRAERARGGDGRTYTVTYTASDDSGNFASASSIVTVPGNQKSNNR